MKKKEIFIDTNVERFEPDPLVGLTKEQVELRKSQRLINKTDQKIGRGYAKIFARHLLTFFNIMYVVITVLLAIAAALQVGKNIPHYDRISLPDFTFLLIVSINTIIGLVQEIKSKITIDRLSLLSQPSVTVIRDGKKHEISINEVVLDDIMFFQSTESLHNILLDQNGYRLNGNDKIRNFHLQI